MIPLFAAVPVQVTAVRLVRGAEIPLAPGLPRYFDVAEAVIDAKEADIAQPQEYAAAVGPERAMLVRFGSLDAVLPAGARVTGATLRLTSADGEPIKIKAVRRVLAPWKGAGPSVLSARLRKGEAVKPRASATWNLRRLGAKWGRAGVLSDLDSAAIDGTTIGADGTISGLAGSVQAMADRWWSNEGFLVQFEAPGLVGSSLSPKGRPELTIEWEPGAQFDLAQADLAMLGRVEGGVRVANLGAAASGAFRVRTVVDGKAGEWGAAQGALAPGASVIVPVSGGANGVKVVYEVESGDANPRNDAVETISGGKPVNAPTAARAYGVARAVRLWNAAAEASRYGFAPDGPSARLTYVGVGESSLPDETMPAIFPALSALAGIPESASVDLDAARMPRIPEGPARGAASRFPGLSGGGDSRGEAAITLQTDLPNDPYDDALIRRLALEPSGALSLYDVAALEAGGEPALPRAAVAQVRNASGRPLADLSLEVYGGDANGFSDQPLVTLKTNADGIAVIPSRIFGPKILAFSATLNGEREVAFLKDIQLRAAAARGNIAPILGLRLNLPTLPVVREGSLASGKFVTDSLGTAANVLGLAVDGDGASLSKATYPAGGWMEIDLGRDRTLAEVPIRAEAMPRRFDLRLRMTGEDASGATLWASEGDWAWTRANRPDPVLGGSGVLYRGTAQRGRYLRLVFPEGGEVAIGEILAFAARVAG